LSSPIHGARLAHSIPKPRRIQPKPNSDTDVASSDSAQQQPKSESDRPKIESSAYYQLSFTCVPCGHRSHHNVSKQGYHTGSTLITCPECRNRHVISDHLGIFGDRKITVEDLLREKGQLVKRGSLGEDGDIEFWPDDQQTASEGSEGTGKS
jgi:mitochondrial protein import protein ZIM17